ncbi:MAG: xanthine dehydrogenase family protein, partial [Nocardioides sp.]|nr:xanthine dehydrogenase family protein [Nocardioides sp.]
MTTRLFGQKVPRVEDQRFLRGKGRYVDDILVGAHAGTLHAAVLRSPHAHARILEIDVDEVLGLEGVHAVWTHEDLTGAMAAPLPLLIPHPALTHGRTQFALAKDEVNYVGEAIAFVVADDRYVAEDAVDRIRVGYEFLPPVVGIEAARAATNLVHDDVPGNVGARMEQKNGDAPAAIAKAPHTLSLDLFIERSSCQPMEGRGVVARWDPDTSRLTVWSSTQTSTGVRGCVAARLDLALAQVDVVTPDVGGGFGVKVMHPWPEELLVPMAARALGRPVKFTEDRREHFISSAHERAQVHHVEVGFDDDGRVLGLDVQFWHDHGAYSPYGLIVPIITATQLLGPYKPGAYRVRFESLFTNTVMVTPYRGAGRPQGCFVMERTMDAIAAELGMDRAEVRANNFIQPDEFPYEHGLVFQDGRELTYDSGDYPASLEKIKALIGWDDFPALKAEAAKEG